MCSTMGCPEQYPTEGPHPSQRVFDVSQSESNQKWITS